MEDGLLKRAENAMQFRNQLRKEIAREKELREEGSGRREPCENYVSWALMTRRCYKTRREAARAVVQYVKKYMQFLPKGSWKVSSIQHALKHTWGGSHTFKCNISLKGQLPDNIAFEMRTKQGKEKGVKYEYILYYFLIYINNASPVKKTRRRHLKPATSRVLGRLKISSQMQLEESWIEK